MSSAMRQWRVDTFFDRYLLLCQALEEFVPSPSSAPWMLSDAANASSLLLGSQPGYWYSGVLHPGIDGSVLRWGDMAIVAVEAGPAPEELVTSSEGLTFVRPSFSYLIGHLAEHYSTVYPEFEIVSPSYADTQLLVCNLNGALAFKLPLALSDSSSDVDLLGLPFLSSYIVLPDGSVRATIVDADVLASLLRESVDRFNLPPLSDSCELQPSQDVVPVAAPMAALSSELVNTERFVGSTKKGSFPITAALTTDILEPAEPISLASSMVERPVGRHARPEMEGLFQEEEPLSEYMGKHMRTSASAFELNADTDSSSAVPAGTLQKRSGFTLFSRRRR